MHELQASDLPYYTYDDYIVWEGRWEVICGLPYAMSPAPSIKHQKISSRIENILEEKLSNCQQCFALLPVDWKITEDTIVQPDNMVICHQPEHEQYITKAPDIIFEVLSKSTAHKDRSTKFNLYESEGVKFYILVYQYENTAKIYELNQGRYIKLKDVRDETISFDLSDCQFDFEFNKIWGD